MCLLVPAPVEPPKTVPRRLKRIQLVVKMDQSHVVVRHNVSAMCVEKCVGLFGRFGVVGTFGQFGLLSFFEPRQVLHSWLVCFLLVQHISC